MRTKAFFHPAILAMGLFAFQNGQAQVSIESNSPGFPGTDYVGWDAGTTVPLMVRHNANQPIQWFTDARRRMQLYQTLPLLTINGFDSLDLSGYLALSGNPAFFNNTRPFSRLHLADTAAAAIINGQVFGFRPWQRNGITFTGNGDHGYFGQEHNGRDTTDMVLMWSNDFGDDQFAPDHLSIRFMSNFLDVPSGASSLRGLEAMRFFPVDRTRVNVGIGDFIAGNINDPLVTEPTEILDVLDGRVRIRQLPEDGAAVDSFHVMVVDRTLGNERGVVKWVDPSILPGADDCDWVVGQSPNEPHLATAYAGSSCDWDQRHGVAIGQDEPKYKLSVYHTDIELLEPTAIWGSSRFTTEEPIEVVGVYGEAMAVAGSTQISAMSAFGVMGNANSSKHNTGVEGTAGMGPFMQGTAARAVGVSGIATATENVEVCIGVYGEASGGTMNNWGGFFEGRGFLGASTWTYSDAGLKTGVEELLPASGLETILGLRPRRYFFNTEEYPHLHFPVEEQFGLIAQEVEEVLPSLVLETRRPERLDSSGTVVQEALDFMAMNYTGLIPILIAAVQAQQGQLAAAAATEAELQDRLAAQEARGDELAARLDQLEQALALCCSRIDPSQSPLAPEEDLKIDLGGDRLLRIDPNPFTDRTTIRYTLERGGRTMLLVNSSDGKQLQVLHEEVKQAGDYQQEWHTSHLAPGIYYVTMLLDGEPLVKRAVKVN